MEQQIIRLKTYLQLPEQLFFQPHKEKAFISLSEKGLYYCNKNQQLKCCFCEFKKEFKEKYDLLTEHDCCVLDRSNLNIPISIKSDETVFAEFRRKYSEDRYLKRSLENDDGLPEPVVKTKLTKPCYSSGGAEYVDKGQATPDSVEKHRFSIHYEQIGDGKPNFTETSSELLPNPTSGLVTANEIRFCKRLKTAGFINLGDRAYCPTCRGEVWLRVHQDPVAVHREFYPACPFILKMYFDDGISLCGRSPPMLNG